jgi:capsular exopolysaccharide synthesis family protein
VDLADYLAILRRHLRLVALCTLLGLLLAACASVLTPRQFEARAQLFVSTQGQDSTSLLQGSSFTQQRVKSYAEVITSPLLLRPVIDELGLAASPEDLAQSITTTVPLDTVLIDVAVVHEDPQQAADIANAITRHFAEVVPTLENSSVAESPVQVTAIRDAAAPGVPASPNVPLFLAAGTLLGLLVGISLALVRGLTDTVVRGENEVKALTDAVVIGGIPYAKESQESPLIVHDDPLSPRAEAFRTLRTNLQFVDAAHPAKSIVFTSSVPGEGKTTTAANVAFALGESGAKICLVEADLRRPRVTSYLGLVEGVGLTNLILGDVDYEDVMQPFGQTNVVVIGAGPIPPNPSELLGSPAMEEIIGDLVEAFDYVLFDAPPLLPVTDAAVLSKRVGGAVVVVGVGIVRKEQLRRTLALLETVGAEVLGTVLNRLPSKGADAYSYYRQGYESDPVYDPNATRASRKRRRLLRSG